MRKEDVYIPGRTGVSETILHSDFFLNDEPLLHYGVLGMKWGVRRARQNKTKAYRYNPYAHTDTGGGKVSTKKERKRLGISKEFEENMIRDMIRYEAEKNNKSVSYHDVKTMLKNDYRDLIEMEEMDRY